MPEAVKWRYSIVKEGRPHEVDVSMADGVLTPKNPNPLLPQPLRVTDPEAITKSDIEGLTDGSVVAEKAEGGSLFRFTSVQPIRRQTVRPSIPAAREGMLDPTEEYMRDKIVERYKEGFRLASEADRTAVMEALVKDRRGDIIRGLERLRQSDMEDAGLLLSVIDDVRHLEDGKTGVGRKLLDDLTGSITHPHRRT